MGKNESLESEGSPSGSGQRIKEWKVMITVTEYHYFTIEAESQEEAERIADEMMYATADSDSASDTYVEVQSVKEVEE